MSTAFSSRQLLLAAGVYFSLSFIKRFIWSLLLWIYEGANVGISGKLNCINFRIFMYQCTNLVHLTDHAAGHLFKYSWFDLSLKIELSHFPYGGISIWKGPTKFRLVCHPLQQNFQKSAERYSSRYSQQDSLLDRRLHRSDNGYRYVFCSEIVP